MLEKVQIKFFSNETTARTYRAEENGDTNLALKGKKKSHFHRGIRVLVGGRALKAAALDQVNNQNRAAHRKSPQMNFSCCTY